MVSPKYENGQVVFYKPIGGPNSDTAESTGIITDILMEPGQQANMNVNASAAQPRYEIQNYNTGNTTSVFEENILGEKERRTGKKEGRERATVESGQWKEQRQKVNNGKSKGSREGKSAGGRSERQKGGRREHRKAAGADAGNARGKEPTAESWKMQRQKERSKEPVINMEGGKG
ncbi:hypothetical protein V495_01241 [Pseudogymnoascus sp. VKM F-4514 (FW-929)]|nr:hypothetical protein V495_01241 [Pseudogymnoascus sp. VKM F-4514 (FW-929)]KFY59576.1 hypothetical protein V497_04206 [Pseudogymnoascus sp. VKM F-4516 (FW-969)]